MGFPKSFKITFILFNLGVDQHRFEGKKPSPAVIENIKQTSEESDAVSREKVYENARAEIQYQFR